MRRPTPVTTRIITAESGSRRNPQSATKLVTEPEVMWYGPAGTHSKRIFSATRWPSGIPRSWKNAPSANTNETPTLPTQIALAAALLRRRPMKNISAAPASGNIGISQMRSRKNGKTAFTRFPLLRTRLPLQQIHFIGQHRRAIAEKRDDDSQTHGRFRRRIGNNENRENLAVDAAPHARKRHQVDIHRVQNELDGHQNDDHVAARQHADHSDDEQRQAQINIMAHRQH